MSQKLIKILHRYSKKASVNFDDVKKKFKTLGKEEKARLLVAMKNLIG